MSNLLETQIRSIIKFIKDHSKKGTTYHDVAESMDSFYEENEFLTLNQVKYLGDIIDDITATKKVLKQSNDQIENFLNKSSTKKNKSNRSKQSLKQIDTH